MAWMSDEKFVMVSDSREKKSIGASAFKRRTHCGKGGRVKLPHDNCTKKELEAMNGECKVFRMNDPMTWEQFKEMPDDDKILYIRALREKFNVPDKEIAEMFGVMQNTVYRWFKCLGLTKGMGSGAKTLTWNKDGWLLWLNGESPNLVKPSETPVEEDAVSVDEIPVEEDAVSVDEIPVEEDAVSVDEIPVEEAKVEDAVSEIMKIINSADNNVCSDKVVKDEHNEPIKDKVDNEKPIPNEYPPVSPIAFTGHHMPVIPKSGTMTFEHNYADDAMATIKCLLSNARMNLTISWECVREE